MILRDVCLILRSAEKWLRYTNVFATLRSDTTTVDEVDDMEKTKQEEHSVTLDILKNSIQKWTNGSVRYETPIDGLMLFQHNAPTSPTIGLYEPSICLVAQGAKRAQIGEGEAFDYNTCHYLITSIHMPALYQVTEASEEHPFLGLTIRLNQQELSQLVLDIKLPSPHIQPDRGMSTGEVNLPILSVFQRLLGLLEEPDSIPILAPLIQRELLYRLLTSPQGERLRQIALSGSQSAQIAQAIEWLQVNFSQTLRVEELAQQVHMSKSTFHHHFKAMTALSPLQFQKQLRLQEARRLMLVKCLDAGTAAFEVGYESPSQFSREYKRMFGASPTKDIASIREGMPQVA
mgnify:CR=1 FL=1|tara:strand:- start:1705 stop:2742 length:1038 start_codon:yes stop_codon:yes gene_type:complete